VTRFAAGSRSTNRDVVSAALPNLTAADAPALAGRLVLYPPGDEQAPIALIAQTGHGHGSERLTTLPRLVDTGR
jgi:hypothetical protein